MSFFEDLKATAGQVLKKVGDTVGEAKDRLGLEYQIRTVRGQISDAEESARAAHEAMGKRVYELYKAGQITDTQLVNGSQEVEALARKIEELNQQIMKMREDFEREQAAHAAAAGEPAAGAPAAGAADPGATPTTPPGAGATPPPAEDPNKAA